MITRRTLLSNAALGAAAVAAGTGLTALPALASNDVKERRRDRRRDRKQRRRNRRRN